MSLMADTAKNPTTIITIPDGVTRRPISPSLSGKTTHRSEVDIDLDALLIRIPINGFVTMTIIQGSLQRMYSRPLIPGTHGVP